MRRDECGHITVEFLGAFIPFLLLAISILSLVNISATQARMHNALTQTALTISMYSYVMHTIDEVGGGDAFDRITDLLMSRQARNNYSRPNHLENNPAIEGRVSGAIAEATIRQLMERFLYNSGENANLYLINSNVIGGLNGLDFMGSVIIDDDENVTITVNYQIAYSFGNLRMPFPNPYLEVTQTVKTKAWLGGYGEGYG